MLMSTQISQKVPFGEKVCYSLGDAAANLVFQMMMIYQLKFYTDVFGLEGAIAGSVLLIARIVDAFVDPTVGILSDKTQTRWGKFRPWVVWTALPFMVFYVLAFWNPGIENKTLVATYATVSYVLLMTLYSFNNTPYSSLGGVMSGDIKERTSITSIRFVASTVAQFVVQGLTLPLVDKFGRSAGSDDAHGWLCTISLFAAIGFVFLIISGSVPKERIAPPAGQKMDLKNDLKGLFANVPWRSMFILTLFVFITLAMWGSAMCFYFQNYVNQDALYEFIRSMGLVRTEGEELGWFASILNSFGLIAYSADKAYSIGLSLFNMIGALVQLVGVITLSEFLANRFGKRSTFIVCLSLTALLTAAFILPAPTSIGMIFLLGALKSLAYAPTVPLLWAMIADVADHMEYVTHRRATGLCFSGVVFSLKAGLGVGGAIAGMILSLFGYINDTTVAQTATSLLGIRLASSVVPALCFFVGVVALCYYPITKQFNEKMQAELAERRAKQSE
jgi:Na+/melibiose symporter-like transporter